MKKLLSVKDAKLGAAGESAAITEAMPVTSDATEKFKAIVTLANRVAWGFNEGALNTCIESSYALAGALTDLGYADARPVRVEAASFPEDREIQHVILGSLRPRSRTRKGYWCGHLAVCVGQSWLLDPTLDQSNYVHGTQWADAGIGVEPAAVSLTPEFWDLDLPLHQSLVWVHFSGVSTRYTLAPQNSFARAGALRPSFWRPLANEITRRLEQTQACPKRIGEILRRNPQPCKWIENEAPKIRKS